MLAVLEGVATPPAVTPPRHRVPGLLGSRAPWLAGSTAFPPDEPRPLPALETGRPSCHLASNPTSVPHMGAVSSVLDCCVLCPTCVSSTGKSPRNLRPTQPNPRLCLQGTHSGYLAHL